MSVPRYYFVFKKAEKKPHFKLNAVSPMYLQQGSRTMHHEMTWVRYIAGIAIVTWNSAGEIKMENKNQSLSLFDEQLLARKRNDKNG